MSDNEVKKTCLMFDEDGNIIFSYYSPFGEIEERILPTDDMQAVTKYVDFLVKNGFKKVLDKYTLSMFIGE